MPTGFERVVPIRQTRAAEREAKRRVGILPRKYLP
jgi:hypothetical protein